MMLSFISQYFVYLWIEIQNDVCFSSGDSLRACVCIANFKLMAWS